MLAQCNYRMTDKRTGSKLLILRLFHILSCVGYLYIIALLHKKVIPPPTPSPELIDDSTTVELILESEPKTASPSQTSIKIEKLEIEDSSVKIEEVPLTVPKANHAVISKKIQNVVPNVTIKKSSSSNKKSPRKVIPTRGEF